MRSDNTRGVIGAICIDLVKVVKNLSREHPQQVSLSTAARAVVGRRVTLTEWIALEVFLEMLAVLERLIIKGDERRALELGATGGPTLRGAQKAYALVGDPMSSVMAMRHAWRAHYNFGVIACEELSPSSVRYRVEQYPDMPMVHGLMTAGWGVAAARAAGATHAEVELRQRPWQGATSLVYDLRF